MLSSKWRPYAGDNWDDYEERLRQLYNEHDLTPAQEDVFRAFDLVDPEDVRVIILGQDPYPTAGDADGLAFSTRATKTPRSLRNIFNETGCQHASNSLDAWAKQGVLLVNTSPVCIVGQAGSLTKEGKPLFDLLANFLRQNPQVVVVLWGGKAHITYTATGATNPTIVTSHPSPLSARRGEAPFVGSRVFDRINQLLDQPIDWST